MISRMHILDVYESEILPNATYRVSGVERTRATWWLMCAERGWCNIVRSGGRLTFSVSPNGPSRATEVGKMELSGTDVCALRELLLARGFKSIHKTVDLTVTGEWAPLSEEDQKLKAHENSRYEFLNKKKRE